MFRVYQKGWTHRYDYKETVSVGQLLGAGYSPPRPDPGGDRGAGSGSGSPACLPVPAAARLGCPADHRLQLGPATTSLCLRRTVELIQGKLEQEGGRAAGSWRLCRGQRRKPKKKQAPGNRKQAQETPLCPLKQLSSPEKHKPQKPTLVHGHTLPWGVRELTATEKAAPQEPCE